ncbi:two component, sigma54 specific, transcriptional regulator, Fis family [Cribrihabitans marinus]|uniref:Two component, sigma54 specific, transcriptional regulator, Fis family n=1 Tax=Cribrihabitans marinus TaxID=1227549 RepID=A0A1H6R0K1_9RHOB|nr:sigma-54 dependent transcriptional regulator [Cribrihabitans marinus]GGH20248.1 Fis family transcriptional regulator [Cribrihabitans marinus]SEI49303.1 two component, sigma54 specific, transcriptional regulator, Fis family [Cribrihabitans marinus]
MIRKVLLVDDDAAVREALSQTLELADYVPMPAASFVAAKDHITEEFDGVIVTDIRMPGRDGFHLLNYARERDPELPIVLLTGEGDIPMAVKAMGEGAFDFLEKPCAAADLLEVLERAARVRADVLEARRVKRQMESGDPAARLIFGISGRVEAMRERVRNVARSGAEVLVTGPPGSGISKVAEVIHLMSPAAQGPFVKRAAAGLTPDGFARVCPDAAGGSLFLDEVSAMSEETQYAVLDRIEQGAEMRILAGTTVDLADAVTQGGFNADLFYRLDVMRVRIPSLAERPEDIPVIFRSYVAQAAEQAGVTAPEITPDHLAALMARDWPGNARALMSEAMRFVLGLPEDVAGARDLGLAEQMARVERSLLVAALDRCNGRAAEAAKALKLPRKTFYDKLAKYAIRPDSFRP